MDRQGSPVAYLIDRMLGQQEIVVKPISQMLNRSKAFSGVAISRDGKPMLIVDVNNLAA
jgi:two-component system chemotaxis sensor kinase CheA